MEEDSRRVINFATKAQWVRHMSQIMDEDLAQSYADEFFHEKEERCYTPEKAEEIISVRAEKVKPDSRHIAF